MIRKWGRFGAFAADSFFTGRALRWSIAIPITLAWSTAYPLPLKADTPQTQALIHTALPDKQHSLHRLALKESVDTGSIGFTPPEPADLWERIRRGLRLKFHHNPKVRDNLKWFRRNSDYLQRVRDRAEPWLYYIVEEIEKRHLPMDIVLLPIVESAFQPHVVSPSRAAGIWQFIPATGEMYGLKENWWYNGRNDVIDSTLAALSHLKRLAAIFNDDWELVLAAYNSGAGRVRRAILANQKKGKKTNFSSLDLPRETRNYVPRLQALTMIIKDPAAYGQTLRPIANTPYFSSIDIEAQLDLTIVSNMVGIKTSQLLRLNPGLKRWATAPDGPHRLNLPKEKKELFISELSRLPPEKRMHWKRYEIRQGDSLSVIADKFDQQVALLQQVNALQGTRIQAGRNLLIPVPSDASDFQTLIAQLPKRSEYKKRQNKNHDYHIVKSGDSLWGIARRYKLNHKTLARWNAISIRSTLIPGQRLVIRERSERDNAHSSSQVSSEQTL